MPEPIDDLRALIATTEFEAVYAAVLALPPALLIDPAVGAHFGALRTGLLGVDAAVTALIAAEAAALEEPGAPGGEPYEDNPPAEDPGNA